MYRKKNIIIGIMCLAIVFMGVVFAVFETRLTINGTGNVLGDWNIAITNIESTPTGTAQNLSNPIFGGTSATIHAGLKKPGDKMTYSITVSNSGNIDALIVDVLINTSGAGEVIYSVENLNKNHKLAKGSTLTFNLITEFDRNATSIPVLSSKQIDISIVVLQDDGSTPTPIAPEIVDSTTQYGIMYVANGGSGTMSANVCPVGQPCTLNTSSFKREGYLFKGWSTNPLGLVEYTNGQTVTDIINNGKTQVLYAVWEDINIVSQIMYDNNAELDTNIDFSKISSDTNGKGLYYTKNNTEGDKPTYYFRGDVKNNYVKFGKDSSGNDIVWRIVRINEDGSIRLITQNSVGSSEFNTNYNDNAYVGYMYGLPETDAIYGDINEDGTTDVRDGVLLAQYISDWDLGLTKRQILLADMNFDGRVTEEDAEIHAQVRSGWSYNLDNYSSTGRYNKTHANINDSTVKTYLDNWYVNNLENYSSYLADAGFCNDRSVASTANTWSSDDTTLGYGKNYTYYGTYNRLYTNKTPQFACPQENDLFTLNGSSKGNKALTNPIGLITIDEVAYAGGVDSKSNTSMYLTNSEEFLTMSPYSYDALDAETWYVGSGGSISSLGESNSIWIFGEVVVRPVINLKSTAKISSMIPSGCTEQNGTESCPYIIDTSSVDTNSTTNIQ